MRWQNEIQNFSEIVNWYEEAQNRLQKLENQAYDNDNVNSLKILNSRTDHR